MKTYIGFGWVRINFIHRNHFGAVFWICAGKRDILVTEQDILRAKAFAVHHSTPLARGLEKHKELGGATVRTADPK